MAAEVQTGKLRNNALGRYGESVAMRYLQSEGMHIIQRNWRCATGEIDIVALSGDVLVICEVKTRTDDRFGGPLSAISPAKLNRLRQLAALWLADHPIAASGVRIDVIAIWRPTRGKARVEHLVGVQ